MLHTYLHQSYPALHLHPTNEHNHVCAVTYEHEYSMVQHRSYIDSKNDAVVNSQEQANKVYAKLMRN